MYTQTYIVNVIFISLFSHCFNVKIAPLKAINLLIFLIFEYFEDTDMLNKKKWFKSIGHKAHHKTEVKKIPGFVFVILFLDRKHTVTRHLREIFDTFAVLVREIFASAKDVYTIFLHILSILLKRKQIDKEYNTNVGIEN